MKELLILIMSMGLTLSVSAVPQLVTLGWDALPVEMRTADKTIRIYSSTDLLMPKALWPQVGSVGSTTNFFSLFVEPGAHYFVATAHSAFWGIESDFSAVALTPPSPVATTNFFIRLGP